MLRFDCASVTVATAWAPLAMIGKPCTSTSSTTTNETCCPTLAVAEVRFSASFSLIAVPSSRVFGTATAPFPGIYGTRNWGIRIRATRCRGSDEGCRGGSSLHGGSRRRRRGNGRLLRITGITRGKHEHKGRSKALQWNCLLETWDWVTLSCNSIHLQEQSHYSEILLPRSQIAVVSSSRPNLVALGSGTPDCLSSILGVGKVSKPFIPVEIKLKNSWHIHPGRFGTIEEEQRKGRTRNPECGFFCLPRNPGPGRQVGLRHQSRVARTDHEVRTFPVPV